MQLSILLVVLALLGFGSTHMSMNTPLFSSAGQRPVPPDGGGVGSSGSRVTTLSGGYDLTPVFNRGQTITILTNGVGQGHANDPTVHFAIGQSSPSSAFDSNFNGAQGRISTTTPGGGFSNNNPTACTGAECQTFPVPVTLPSNAPLGRTFFEMRSLDAVGTDWFALAQFDMCGTFTIADCPTTPSACPGTILQNGNNLGVNGGATGCPADIVCPCCGDGVISASINENCDDGDSASGDGCSNICRQESGYLCSGTPSNCNPQCGDGLRVGNEQNNGRCEDGNAINGDGCSSSCTVESGFTCTPSTGSTVSNCSPIPVCGNGMLESGEMCDDGDNANGDGCSATCTVENGFTCNMGSPTACSMNQMCGDGILMASEVCDDGNTVNGDGCTATCTVETGFDCGTTDPSVCSPVCGDGLLIAGEACDDSNTVSGDGCSDTCTVETDYTCTGIPSVCRPSGINGNTNSDGNTESGGSANTGMIVGIVVAIIGVCCLLVIGGIIGFFLWRRNRDSSESFEVANTTYDPSLTAPKPVEPQPTTAPIPMRSLSDIQANMSTGPAPTATGPPMPPTSARPAPPVSQARPPMPPVASRPNVPSPSAPPMTINSMVQAQYSGDNKFYKARILKVNPQANTYYVNYVDFGNDAEWVPMSRIKN